MRLGARAGTAGGVDRHADLGEWGLGPEPLHWLETPAGPEGWARQLGLPGAMRRGEPCPPGPPPEA